MKYVEELGYKAIFLTVDAVVMSNRERDIKAKPGDEDQEADVHAAEGGSLAELTEEVDEVEVLDLSGTAGALVANDDRDMTWEKACQMIPVYNTS